jgi:hypothetical protein
MQDKIHEELKKMAKNGRISCPVARKIAEELSVSYKEVGKAADELNIKIKSCELGCF